MSTGSAWTSPKILLRLEPAALLAGTVWLYADFGRSWWLFVLLILAPDLSVLGYLRDRQFGAMTYNLVHTLVWSTIICLAGWQWSELALSLGLIWAAHIFADRAIGYGLKYPEGFRSTHLQRV
jgi:hypothetical protein